MQNVRLTQNNTVLVVQPHLIHLFGATKALFISQLNYWIRKESSGVIFDGKRWIFNTAKDLAKQIGVSVRQMERIVSNLREEGIIQVEKLAPYKSNRTNYYTLNYDLLSEILKKNGFLDSSGDSDFRNSASVSSRHDVGMVHTKNTNKKEITKSDKIDLIVIEGVGEGAHEFSPVSPKEANRVDQVKNTKSNFDERKQGDSQSPVKNTTAQDMLEFWNKTCPNAQKPMSRELAPLLVSAFKTKFESDLNKWKHYCLTIESSSYLTGAEFKLSLYWALKYQTIDRIRAGEFGVKSVPIPGEAQRLENDLIGQIHGLSEPEKCKTVRFMLLKAYGPMVYKSWFQALEFSMNGEDVRFTAPSPFHGDYVAKTYGEILR